MISQQALKELVKKEWLNENDNATFNKNLKQ